MTSEELEALEKLEKAATPGPWVYERSPGDMEVGYPDQFDVIAPNGNALCSMFTSDWGFAETHGKLIPALRNAAPALIAAARENAKLRAKLAAAEKALDEQAEAVGCFFCRDCDAVRCEPAVLSPLRHIAEQAGKRNWWNVLHTILELNKAAIRSMNRDINNPTAAAAVKEASGG